MKWFKMRVVTRDHCLDGRQVRLDAMETPLEQRDQARTLHGKEPVLSLPVDQLSTNSCVDLETDL